MIRLWWLFFFLIQIGCITNNSNKAIIHYGCIVSEVVDFKYTTLKLDEYSSFDTLMRDINNAQFKGTIPVIEIDNLNHVINICLWNTNLENEGCIHIKEFNMLLIKDNKINGLYPIDSLESIYGQHYLNYGKSEVYSRSPEKCIVKIVYTSSDMDGIKEIILRLVNEFDRIKVSDKFVLMINRPIPPPPPSFE